MTTIQKEHKPLPVSEIPVKSNPYRKKFPYNEIDIYRILRLYEVTDPCVQHAVKKLLCAGKRGSKNYYQDIDEAKQTLERFGELNVEEVLKSVKENHEQYSNS